MPKWIVATLRTITHDHRKLRQITVHMAPSSGLDCVDVKRAIGETAYQEWLDLDRLLVNLWESHSIRPKVLYTANPEKDGGRARTRMKSLLPELTTREIVELIERRDEW
jgi:hypothetical protein